MWHKQTMIFLGANYSPDAAKHAHRLIRIAIRLGKLIPSNHCEQCGKKIGPNRVHKDGHEGKPWGALQPHHEDYAQPFLVVWLCGRCHIQRHYGPGEWVWSEEAQRRLQTEVNISLDW